MPDDPANPTPANNVPNQSPAGGASPNQGGSPSNPPSSDPVKMAEELGRLKKIEDDYKKYVASTDPVIQTLWSDSELLNKVTSAHNKRLGITPRDPDPDPDNPPPPPAPPSKETTDTRNWAIKKVVDEFHSKHEMDKLDDTQRQELDQKVAAVLRETLNPTGGKTLSQIMEDVPLEALPNHLDKAFYWATRDEKEKQLKEQGRREALQESTGIIGSMVSSSGGNSGEDIILTLKQKETARKMGVSEEDYLKSLKELASRGNQLY